MSSDARAACFVPAVRVDLARREQAARPVVFAVFLGVPAKKLKARSNVEVVRRGLKLLKEQTDRDLLRKAYESASRQVADALRDELDELDHLAGEGLD